MEKFIRASKSFEVTNPLSNGIHEMRHTGYNWFADKIGHVAERDESGQFHYAGFWLPGRPVLGPDGAIFDDQDRAARVLAAARAGIARGL